MSNEVLFVGLGLIWLSLSLMACKMGKAWLQGFISISYIGVITSNTQLVDVFGITTLIGGPVYAGIFLATDILTEKYGKKVGYETIWISFSIALLFVGFIQLVLLFEPVAFSQTAYDALQTTFGTTLRVAIAGPVAYIIANRFDVWFYHWLHERTGEKHLWFRNNASTLTSQTLGNTLFFTLAFYGVMATDVFLQVIFVGFVVKWTVAIADTPFIYLAKKIKPLDLK